MTDNEIIQEATEATEKTLMQGVMLETFFALSKSNRQSLRG